MFKLLAVLFLCACGGGIYHSGYPTLLVVNRGFEDLRVTDEYGFTLARVYSGDSACVKLTRDIMQQLIFSQPYKTPELTPRFSPFTYDGWRIEIHNTLAQGVLSLGPAERC